jgi:hypothetical protein
MFRNFSYLLFTLASIHMQPHSFFLTTKAAFMKKMLVILLALTCYTVQAQRWGKELSLGYVNANPTGSMGEIIQRGHGILINYAFVTPNQRYSFGIDLSYAQYGRDKSTQAYTMDDGTVAPMDIIVTNSFADFMAYSRLYLSTKGAVRPFLVGKLGYTKFSTNLDIYDPDDGDHCEPVDNEVLYNDGTVKGVLGAGVKFDVGKIFNIFKSNLFYIDCSINYAQGGSVRYMNADAPPHHPAPNDAVHLTADFINTQTQVVHKHHVGYLYENPVRMTELRFAMQFNFAR